MYGSIFTIVVVLWIELSQGLRNQKTFEDKVAREKVFKARKGEIGCRIYTHVAPPYSRCWRAGDEAHTIQVLIHLHERVQDVFSCPEADCFVCWSRDPGERRGHGSERPNSSCFLQLLGWWGNRGIFWGLAHLDYKQEPTVEAS